MKADYTRAIKTISGKIDNFVHMRWKAGNRGIIRRYTKPEPGEHNYHFAVVIRNIVVIWKECSAGFKQDLKSYALQRVDYYSGEEIPAQSNYAHFVRLIYAYRDKHPEIDLANITKPELEAAGIPTTVKGNVEEGLLPPIPNVEGLTNDW